MTQKMINQLFDRTKVKFALTRLQLIIYRNNTENTRPAISNESVKKFY